MKTNIGAILIVLLLAFGGIRVSTHSVRDTLPPTPPAVTIVAPPPQVIPVLAAEPHTSRGVKGRTAGPNPATGAKHKKHVERVYKGFTCGDVRRMVQVNGDVGAEWIARSAGATDAEIRLARKCVTRRGP